MALKKGGGASSHSDSPSSKNALTLSTQPHYLAMPLRDALIIHAYIRSKNGPSSLLRYMYYNICNGVFSKPMHSASQIWSLGLAVSLKEVCKHCAAQ